jgi:glycosyltransferase involved in cell wall biosynthesis
LRVLRVYHGGRDPAHRQRERALLASGVDIVLVVPAAWPGPSNHADMTGEPFPVLELEVVRPGDVNRHKYRDGAALAELVERTNPDVIDIHEEPFSLAARQWLAAAGARPVVMYTAQNIDKRFPPPFAQYERRSLERTTALYPCSRQAAAVARGKGFDGLIEVLPLGIDREGFHANGRPSASEIFTMMLVGRMVPEKGVVDAVRVLAEVARFRPAQLLLVGEGPELAEAQSRAAELGVSDQLQLVPWLDNSALGDHYRRADVVLVPSRATATWAEQFGRVVVEAQACGAVVAGYDSGAVAEVAGPSSILVAEGDFIALGDQVRKLALNPLDLSERQKAGLQWNWRRGWDDIAVAQAGLYQGTLRAANRPRPLSQRLSSRERRRVAEHEFGQTATSLAGRRPFALPILRRYSRATAVLGAGIDHLVDMTHH